MGKDHTEQAETWGDITVCRHYTVWCYSYCDRYIHPNRSSLVSYTWGRYFEAVSETRGWIGSAILLLNISGYVIARCRNLGFFRLG